MLLKALVILESFFWPWKDLLPSSPFTQKDSWVGERPGLVMWLKFLWQSKIRLTNNARLALLDYSSLMEIQSETSYFKNQIIRENQDTEKKLLAKSSLSIFPHEVWQIRIETSQGTEVLGPVHHGRPTKSSTLSDLKKEIGRLSFSARKNGFAIEEIQILHTHPSLEVLIVEKGDSKFVFNGLSKRDRETTEMISQFQDYPVRIVAITPAANYSMLY